MNNIEDWEIKIRSLAYVRALEVPSVSLYMKGLKSLASVLDFHENLISIIQKFLPS